MNLKEQGPNFEYQKGNIDMKVYKSKDSIPKEKIDQNILDFLYTKAGKNGDLLKISDFSIDFLAFKGIKGFVKFNIESGNHNQVEILLNGKDLEDFIEALRQYGSGLDVANN